MTMRKKRAALPAPPIDLESLPGHYIRRLQQIAVALFLLETEAYAVTPVQYAILQKVCNVPGIDQRTLARSIGFDTSTVTGVIDRLEARGLLVRNTTPDDRRVRRLTLTAEGHAHVTALQPAMMRSQERILEPLSAREREQFMRMLRALVNANNSASRAPSEPSCSDKF